MSKEDLLELLKEHLKVEVGAVYLRDEDDRCGLPYRGVLRVSVTFEGVEVASDYEFLSELEG